MTLLLVVSVTLCTIFLPNCITYKQGSYLYCKALRTSLVPTMWETWVQSLDQEDPLEKEMATHSSTVAWKIPWTEEHGRLQSMGLKESDTTEPLHFRIMDVSV